VEENDREVESIPCFQKLNGFAEKLPPEFREQLYREVESFYLIGISAGIFLSGGVGKDERDAYVHYLQKKALESASAIKPAEPTKS
jgi:hypothetical protein